LENAIFIGIVQICAKVFRWLNIPRRVQTIFSRTKYWQGHDVFKRQKDSTFAKSSLAVQELSKRYVQVMAEAALQQVANEEARRLLFIEMSEVALWGNATDLSLLSNLSLEQIQGLQGREAIANSQHNIVDNDLEEVWMYLSNPLRSNRRIDIVLDNAGFEFFTDLIYAAYLLESGLASSIIFHLKNFPWFVSDVAPSDIDSLFSHLNSLAIFPDRTYLKLLIARLNDFFESGAMSTRQHSFWTTAYSFHHMDRVAPGLFKSLRSSALVIFKGDLNYRKLTRDGLWLYTTPFTEAIGAMGAGSGIKVLALRTNKSDTCVGLESQEKVDVLNEEAPRAAWVRNGKYAVASFSDGE
jgi:predicted metal-dependent hydrolase